ncbi:MAG TPA: glycosyltransferase N-terminal domain-containing protein [Candidatus Binatia bacterium]
MFTSLALLLAPLAGLVCLVRPSWRRGLLGRLGVGWPARDARPLLWAHAASVGEVEGIAPLVECWRRATPGGTVVISAQTSTGCEHARRLVPDARVVTFPIDVPGIAGRVVRRVRPDLFLFSENELWPNVLTALDRAGIPAVQVSGRLSPGAAQTLARFPRFSRAVLSRVTRFCVQANEHRERLLALGVPPARVVVTGSLKADGRMPEPPAFVGALQALGRPVVVAGSTHAGEEEAVVAALRELRVRPVAPLWVIAPRHPERFAGVGAMLAQRGLRVVQRSRLPEDERAAVEQLESADVLLLDTLGELAGCYHAATVAFVGGTLVPIGGHNLLEPARCGVPVIVGPHVHTVRALAECLAAAGAAVIVADARELARAVEAFLDPERRAAASAAACSVATEQCGSLPATWAAIEPLLRERRGDAVADDARAEAGAR